MFKRWISLPLKRSFLLMGPRRAGKSTLLKATFPKHHYITLDDLDEMEAAKRDPKGFVDSLGDQFIIDEAQRVPELTVAIKKRIDEQEIHAVITGSSGLQLYEKTTDSLAGRIDILHLPPACFGEDEGAPEHSLLQQPDANTMKRAKRKLESFMKSGGFPEVLNTEDQQQKEEVLRNYKNTYFTRDLAQQNKLESVENIKALFQALLAGIGSHYEVTHLSRESGISVPTTRKYLNTIFESQLAFKLYGYHQGPAKRYISAAKTYFCDNGMIHAFNTEVSRGQWVENFVISEIEKRRKLGFIRADELFFFQSAGGREVDCIVEEPNRIVAIEIKSTQSISGRDIRSLKEFDLGKKSKKELLKVIFYSGDEMRKNEDIHLIPLHHFYRAKWI